MSVDISGLRAAQSVEREGSLIRQMSSSQAQCLQMAAGKEGEVEWVGAWLIYKNHLAAIYQVNQGVKSRIISLSSMKLKS